MLRYLGCDRDKSHLLAHARTASVTAFMQNPSRKSVVRLVYQFTLPRDERKVLLLAAVVNINHMLPMYLPSADKITGTHVFWTDRQRYQSLGRAAHR